MEVSGAASRRHVSSKVGNIQSVLKEALLRARRNSRFRSLGRTLLKFPVSGDILRQFTRRILPSGERVWLQVRTGPGRGLWLKVEPYLEERYLSGCPEPGVQEEISDRLRPGGCFYDAGAHVGFYSLLAARLVGKGGHVVAFEPDPANAAVLQENITRNNLWQIEVVRVALWSHCGVVAFRRSASEHPEVSSRRGAVVSANGRDPSDGQIDVQAMTLDAFAENHPRPTMVKIDVEGAEVEVLKGAQNMVSQIRPILLFEVHHWQAATLLEDQLRQKHYRIDWLAPHPGFPFPRHLLALPPECSDR